jgi:glycerol-3-phosphate dehydrogenase (NAD(P)+)
MSSVLIIGTGQISRAASVPLGDNGWDVLMVPVRPSVVQTLPPIQTPLVPKHPSAQIQPFDSLVAVLNGIEFVVVGVSSVGLQRAAEIISRLVRPEVPILLLTKGLIAEGGRLCILPERLKEMLTVEGVPNPLVLCLGGPYLAAELATRFHTSVVIAGDSTVAARLARYLETSYLAVAESSDIIGVSICSALKNLYAIAVGIGTGRELNDSSSEKSLTVRNTAAAIFTQSLKEIDTLVLHVGGSSSTVRGLAGAGDLHVTCGTGRNHRAGALIGRGISVDEVESIYMLGETIEGLNLARNIYSAVETLFEKEVLVPQDLPLLRFLLNILVHKRSIDIPWQELY